MRLGAGAACGGISTGPEKPFRRRPWESEGEGGGGLIKRRVGRPAYQRVAESLQRMIAAGKLQPGDQLLPERRLAEMFHASRTAVREALAVLSGAGAVELTGQGAFIRRRDLQQISGAFGSLLLQHGSDVLELLEAREIIEGEAARLAAGRRQLQDLQRLWIHAQEVARTVEQRLDATDSDTNFHSALVASAHNEILLQVFEVLEGAMRTLYQPTRRVMLLQESMADDFLGEHSGIIEALRQQDGDRAKELVHAHIQRAIDFTRRGMEGKRDS